MADLEDNILDFDSQIRNTFIALSELDCILAFANCATDLKYVRPEVVPAAENCIQIVNGRHPLQEIVLETEFVANNTCVDSSNRVNIITGPNFSGKSCYARQVGMLVFHGPYWMFHSVRRSPNLRDRSHPRSLQRRRDLRRPSEQFPACSYADGLDPAPSDSKFIDRKYERSFLAIPCFAYAGPNSRIRTSRSIHSQIIDEFGKGKAVLRCTKAESGLCS